MRTEDKLLTLQELADYLGVSVSTLYNRRSASPEDMPRSHRVGRGVIRYRPADVEKWLEAQADPQPAA